MAVTIGGISARIASIKERGDGAAGLIGTVVYHVPWATRFRFYEGLMGELTTITVPGGGSITRRIPNLYPDSASDAFIAPMYAQPDIQVEPLGKILEREDGWADFGKDPDTGAVNGLAEVTVNYQRLVFDPNLGQPYLSESKRGAGQGMTLPGTPFRFVSDAKPIQQDVFKFIPQIEVQRVYDRAGALEEATLFSLAGTVNAATWRGQPAGSWMMAMIEDHTERVMLGTPETGAALSLIWRPYPWNHVFRRDTGLWEQVTPNIYEPADWSPLDVLPT